MAFVVRRFGTAPASTSKIGASFLTLVTLCTNIGMAMGLTRIVSVMMDYVVIGRKSDV